jgi:hypothetical protein
MNYKFLSVILLSLFKSILVFGQYDYPIILDSTNKIELKENRDQMSDYLERIQSKYSSNEQLFIIVLFDVKNDAKSLGKFEKLVKDSLLKKTNDVPVVIILQPIPTEYKYTDLKTQDGKNYPMPTHNMLIYYKKDKSYLDEFTDRMQETTKKMNIWKLDFHDIGNNNNAYIFERIKYGGSCLPDEEELMLKCLMPLFDQSKITKSKLNKSESELALAKNEISSLKNKIENQENSLAKLKTEAIKPPKGININVFGSMISFNNVSLSNQSLGYNKLKIGSSSMISSIRANYPLVFLTKDKNAFLEIGLGFDYGTNRFLFNSKNSVSYSINHDNYETNISLTEIKEALRFQSFSVPIFAKLNYKISSNLFLSNSTGFKFNFFSNTSIERNNLYGSFTRQYTGLNLIIENIPQMGLENNVLLPFSENEIKIKSNLIAENITYLAYKLNPFFDFYFYVGFDLPVKYNLNNSADFISERPDNYHSIFSLKETKLISSNGKIGIGFKINL